MKLDKVLIVKGKIKCITGLFIGGNSEGIDIGGIDNEVIKHPITNEPYIPGSSLKGKMRSQMEKIRGKVNIKEKQIRGKKIKIGEPCGCGDKNCEICTMFGAHKNTSHNLGPTRMLIRDAVMNEDTRRDMNKFMKESGKPYLEVKIENIINRNNGTSNDFRYIERVPSGAKFDLEIVLQIFKNDDETRMKNFLKESLKSVENSYLGGSGSRGYGQVKFIDMELNGEEFTI
ncbi:MAG: type III-A CRISPR-associated RAMP protein Csm3 [Anaeromicrobium sp.]|jgi:CRISPR-associated protein Csm3|uniref:type III-A CRISPR-associated RAMP protein Csm3 n=1 Tax=Anaeromicrobium sp. TaxID=1929132 RepID=UPI0025E4253A|nr:type III-A CRISPR-associated RAMP protein Csm3 [Anaeromicrobium sp.]MCT4593244.1 type III-A CRISPR-associated RAMP protein Csm3 [Anaeromicrobium sp.]